MNKCQFRTAAFIIVIFATIIALNFLFGPLFENEIQISTNQFSIEGSPTNRLDLYCSSTMPRVHGSNSVREVKGWYLAYVVMNIRHGDRSSIHSIPGITSLGRNNEKHPLLDKSALHYTHRFSSFNLSVIPTFRNVYSKVS